MIPLVLLTACGPGTGTVDVSIWAEDEAVEGIETDDGWSVDFTSWTVDLGAIELLDPKDESVVATMDGGGPLDIAASAPVSVGAVEVPAQRLIFGFEVLSQRVVGSASDGTDSFDFELDVTGAYYSNCSNGTDGTDGIATPRDGSADATLTVHPDHPFWTALGTEEAALEFQAWADADTNDDGSISSAELAAVPTIDIGYETSGLVDNLLDHAAFSTQQAAHLNGDGLCTVRSLDAE